MADWSHQIVLTASILSWFIIGAGLAQTAIYLLQLIVAAYALSMRPPVARSALLWHRYGDVAPPIALLVPAYNEALNVVESVHSMLALEYPNFEVIVINDGSKDDTLQRLIEAFRLVKFHRPYEEELAH
ncbi:MAG: glycosyltransferase family 2 protein, partial [Mesorhizobium sp.]